EALDRAAGLAPESAQVQLDRGVALRAAGEGARAVEALGIARRLAPGDAEVAFALAGALADAGRWPEADQALEEAFELQPGLADRPEFEALRQRILTQLESVSPDR
ncbi:MAG: hypothetical protein GYA57_13930, partial [Myxococcales bacterium]|nr:hypothetical protein [Myxococcales bacterium]